MRKIGNTNFAAVIASFENGDASGPFDPRWDVVANPPAPDLANPGPARGSADVNHSSLLFDLQSGSSTVDSATGSDQSSTHQGSIADWIATDFRPFASSLVPFDADAGGRDTSNHGPLDD